MKLSEIGCSIGLNAPFQIQPPILAILIFW